MIKRKTAALLAAFALVCTAAFTGCSGETGADDNGGASAVQPETSSSAELSAGETEQDVATYSVTLTYVNEQYIETGDESLPALISHGTGSVTITGTDSENSTASLETAVNEALDMLGDDPSQHGGGDDEVTMVGDQAFVINGAAVSGDTCTVDLDGTNVYSLDMYTEKYGLEQIADTLFESFADINHVAFTVDGESVEGLSYMSLAGTYERDAVEEGAQTNAEQ